MLKNVDLSREVAKAEYNRLKGDANLKLADLQRQVKALGIPASAGATLSVLHLSRRKPHRHKMRLLV